MDNEKLTAFVKRVKDGDSAAMNEIFDATSAPIFYYCEKVLASSDVDAVVSSIYDYAEKNISSLEIDSEILRWIRLISVQFCAEKLGLIGKKSDFDPSAADGVPETEEVAPEDIMNPAVYDPKIKHAVPKMLEELHPNDRFCAYSYYYYSFSPELLASVLEVDEAGVEARLKIIRFGIKTNVGYYANLGEADPEGLYFSRPLIQSFLLSDAMYKNDENIRKTAYAGVQGGDPNRFRRRDDSSSQARTQSTHDRYQSYRPQGERPTRERMYSDRKYQDEIASLTYGHDDGMGRNSGANRKKFIIILVVSVAAILIAAGVALMILSGETVPVETTTESTETTAPVVTDTLNSISFATEQVTKKVGDVFTLDVIFDPENITDKSLIWRSQNPEIASVDENTGEITIHKAGRTTILAVSRGYLDYSEKPEGDLIKALCVIEAIEAYDEPEVTFARTSVDDISVGELVDLGISVSPAASGRVVGLVIDDETIITMDDSGRVKALKEGTTTIRAINIYTKEEYASCTFVVSGTLADSFTLRSEKLELKVGETAKIECIASPAGTVLKNMKFEISDEGNPEAIQVDADGNITAVSPGVAAVIVYSESLPSDSVKLCIVTVQENKPDYPDLEKLALSEEEMTLCVGENKKLIPIFTPDGIENKSLFWYSSDTSVATVDENGNVTALKPGITLIAAATSHYTGDNGEPIMAQCEVIVYLEAETVKEKNGRTALTLAVSEVASISVDISPIEAISFLQFVSSDESVATIDTTGKITALSEGITTISVKNIYSGKTQPLCNVSVSGRLASGFDLEYSIESYVPDKEIFMLAPGKSFSVNVTFTPSGTILNDMVFESMDPSIASVDKNGRVTAHKEGQTTIAVYSEYLVGLAADPSDVIRVFTVFVEK